MKLLLPLLVVLAVASCKTGTSEKQPDTNAAADSAVFYPVHEFFTEQVKDVDSTPYYLYIVTQKKDRRDSTRLAKEKFDELAKQFTCLNTNTIDFKRNYQENIFDDQSTGSITFTYTAKDKNRPLQNITILLNNENQRVKRIFTTTMRNSGDTVIIEKNGWKTDESFYINRIIQLPGQPEQTETNTVVWNKKD
ncbi:hypothetical protein [Foetidibacter luteolus]|uniref:hypothetical protein n=1 Tax=Foetidibacter luteolus TaxID=2608880 RepID=UPI00129BE741|nr:hypothetical protein [Foetidibacter luteolus]